MDLTGETGELIRTHYSQSKADAREKQRIHNEVVRPYAIMEALLETVDSSGPIQPDLSSEHRLINREFALEPTIIDGEDVEMVLEVVGNEEMAETRPFRFTNGHGTKNPLKLSLVMRDKAGFVEHSEIIAFMFTPYGYVEGEAEKPAFMREADLGSTLVGEDLQFILDAINEAGEVAGIEVPRPE